MGYRKQKTMYKLTFDKYTGLEITAAGLTTGQTIELWEAKADNGPESVTKMLQMFSDALEDWNLETEDGEPVSQDMDGVRSQELPFVMEIIDAWTTALTGTDTELGKDSSSGSTFQGEPIPMEPL